MFNIEVIIEYSICKETFKIKLPKTENLEAEKKRKLKTVHSPNNRWQTTNPELVAQLYFIK